LLNYIVKERLLMKRIMLR